MKSQEPLNDEERELFEKYKQELHAVQSGVAAMQGIEGDGDRSATGPKHLRVGVNAAMSDHAALVGLLVDLGLIERKAYLERALLQMRKEREGYELRLGDIHGGADIRLG